MKKVSSVYWNVLILIRAKQNPYSAWLEIFKCLQNSLLLLCKALPQIDFIAMQQRRANSTDSKITQIYVYQLLLDILYSVIDRNVLSKFLVMSIRGHVFEINFVKNLVIFFPIHMLRKVWKSWTIFYFIYHFGGGFFFKFKCPLAQ